MHLAAHTWLWRRGGRERHGRYCCKMTVCWCCELISLIVTDFGANFLHPIMTLDDHFLYTDVFTGSSEVWAEKILCSEGNPSFSTDSVVRFTIDSGYDWFSGTEPERKPGVTCTLNACPKMSRSGSSTFGYSFIFPGIFGIKQRIHLSLNMVV